jgi:hypothetical protein
MREERERERDSEIKKHADTFGTDTLTSPSPDRTSHTRGPTEKQTDKDA